MMDNRHYRYFNAYPEAMLFTTNVSRFGSPCREKFFKAISFDNGTIFLKIYCYASSCIHKLRRHFVYMNLIGTL